MVGFKSTRRDPSKWNKYVHFTVYFDEEDEEGTDYNCDKLQDHIITDGNLLIMVFEENQKTIVRDWSIIDYQYNNPQ